MRVWYGLVCSPGNGLGYEVGQERVDRLHGLELALEHAPANLFRYHHDEEGLWLVLVSNSGDKAGIHCS